MVIDVGNDGRVTGAIKERERGLFSKGYERIIGIRDMYCAAYDERSGGQISIDVSGEIERVIIREIADMSQPAQISVFFQIMEFEAWILAMYDLLGKVDIRLTWENISNSMNIDLRGSDPEKEFYRPSATLKQILAMAGIDYSKALSDIERLCAAIEFSDFESAIERGRCASFRKFYSEIKAWGVEC
jgi:hypothetical protein